MIYEDFRDNVNRVLERQSITRSELARRMGVSQPFVSQILNGSREPGLRVIERVAQALGVTAQSLLRHNARAAQ